MPEITWMQMRQQLGQQEPMRQQLEPMRQQLEQPQELVQQQEQEQLLLFCHKRTKQLQR